MNEELGVSYHQQDTDYYSARPVRRWYFTRSDNRSFPRMICTTTITVTRSNLTVGRRRRMGCNGH